MNAWASHDQLLQKMPSSADCSNPVVLHRHWEPRAKPLVTIADDFFGAQLAQLPSPVEVLSAECSRKWGNMVATHGAVSPMAMQLLMVMIVANSVDNHAQ